VADPDIRLWGQHNVADPDIRLGREFNMFPRIARLFFHWGGPKSIAKLDEGHCPILPLNPRLISRGIHCSTCKAWCTNASWSK